MRTKAPTMFAMTVRTAMARKIPNLPATRPVPKVSGRRVTVARDGAIEGAGVAAAVAAVLTGADGVHPKVAPWRVGKRLKVTEQRRDYGSEALLRHHADLLRER